MTDPCGDSMHTNPPTHPHTFHQVFIYGRLLGVRLIQTICMCTHPLTHPPLQQPWASSLACHCQCFSVLHLSPSLLGLTLCLPACFPSGRAGQRGPRGGGRRRGRGPGSELLGHGGGGRGAAVHPVAADRVLGERQVVAAGLLRPDAQADLRRVLRGQAERRRTRHQGGSWLSHSSTTPPSLPPSFPRLAVSCRTHLSPALAVCL